ncbi:MerR family transcriptional regulator [Candidatus Omnitrophota bacterium]
MLRNKKSIGEDKMLSAKDIMKKYSLSYQTINHYTDFGILPVSVKKGNVRFYDRRMVEERIRKTRQLMGEGYSLRLIHKKLASA